MTALDMTSGTGYYGVFRVVAGPVWLVAHPA